MMAGQNIDLSVFHNTDSVPGRGVYGRESVIGNSFMDGSNRRTSRLLMYLVYIDFSEVATSNSKVG
jgi:hypothetical protein